MLSTVQCPPAAGSTRRPAALACRSTRPACTRLAGWPRRQALQSPGAERRHLHVSRPAAQGEPQAGAPEPSTAAEEDTEPETTFYEGSCGAPAELAVSLLLAMTLIYIPLTMQSIGRRLWVKYRFTNKRVIITNSSPLFSSATQIPYRKIKEVRAAPRALGAWGDMVIFLKDGQRVELVGMDKFADIKAHIDRCCTRM